MIALKLLRGENSLQAHARQCSVALSRADATVSGIHQAYSNAI